MKKDTKKAILMVTLITAFCVLMAIIDGVFKANYLLKSILISTRTLIGLC